MKCLIIAAGEGKRLKNRGDTKPLVTLLGLSLLERNVLVCKQSGIEEFFVVTGYNRQEVEKHLEYLKDKHKVSIIPIYNEQWQKENGLSVLKARQYLKEPFTLLMADHVIDPQLLTTMKRLKPGKDEVILAVDYKIENPSVDTSDVTKVLAVDGKIRDIGKKIENYNGYDTGVFLCSPNIFTALTKKIENNGDGTLSGAIKYLAEQNKTSACDIGNRYWIDVDTPQMFKKAEKLLMKQLLQKTDDGPVSRFINRPLSIRISKYFLQTSITPNEITVLSFLLSVLASVLFLIPGYVPLAIGGITAQISSIIDGCDGEVARLKNLQSDFGGWLDAVLDRYADAFLLAGLTYHSFQERPEQLVVLIGFLAIIGSFMNSYTADKYGGIMRKLLGDKQPPFRIGRDIRLFIIFIGALFNFPLACLLLLAVIMNLETIRRIFLVYKYRDAGI